MRVKHNILLAAILSFIFLPASSLFAGAARLDRNEIDQMFQQGTQFFHQANDLRSKDPVKAKDLYRQSAMRFERIADEGGIHNGKLYYNIGNAYFGMQDLGRAILYYRLAERLIPDDPNLHQNLTYARSKCLDKIPEKQETQVLKTLFFWHYDLSTTTQSCLLAVFFFSFWILIIIRLFVRKTTLSRLAAVSAVLALVLLGSLGLEVWNRSRYVSGVILASDITARKGDGETYQPSFNEPLHAGTEFNLREDRGEWYRVELADGRSCWVPAKAVGLVK